MFVVGAKKTKETRVVFLTEAKNFLAIVEVVMVVDITLLSRSICGSTFSFGSSFSLLQQ